MDVQILGAVVLQHPGSQTSVHTLRNGKQTEISLYQGDPMVDKVEQPLHDVKQGRFDSALALLEFWLLLTQK